MPLDGSNGGDGWGDGGEELPRKPQLPRAVAGKIVGAEEVLERLAYAMLDRKEDRTPQAQLDRMEIQDNINDTIQAMMEQLTDANFYTGCHDSSPHVDMETATKYIDAAVAHINAKVAMSQRVPSLRPKQMDGKIVEAWSADQAERYPHENMYR